MNDDPVLTPSLASRLFQGVDWAALEEWAEKAEQRALKAMVADQSETSTAFLRGGIIALRRIGKLRKSCEEILSDPKNKV